MQIFLKVGRQNILTKRSAATKKSVNKIYTLKLNYYPVHVCIHVCIHIYNGDFVVQDSKIVLRVFSVYITLCFSEMVSQRGGIHSIGALQFRKRVQIQSHQHKAAVS